MWGAMDSAPVGSASRPDSGSAQEAAGDADVPRFPASTLPVGILFPASQRLTAWAEAL